MKPEFTDFFLNKVLAKNNQQRRSLDHVHTRTTSMHQSISAHTQMKVCRCRWGEGKHAACASREEGYLPPRSRRSRASTCRRRRLSSSSTTTISSSVCLCGRRMVQSRLREEWQGSRSRHHHYPIPSARDEA